MVRAFSSTSPGVSDIYQNGTLYSSQVPVAGKLFGFGGKNALTNTFTCNTSKIPYVNSDTKLYISPNSSIDPVRDFNDDYNTSGGGDFDWNKDSRIKRNFGGASMNAIVTAYSTSTAGVYDFYGNCEFSNITGSFPNLKADDAIQTAPFNSNYNCGSWGGGITSFWFWPDPWSSHSWPGSTYLDSFDKFYGNNPPRYAGAFTYTRSGADASNGVVALWANSSNYQHISVRKPGNDQPHGYDWESKPGQLMRTMHPRDGLQGQSYGSIVAYYRYTGSNARIGESDRFMTMEESIEEGLSKMDPESFTEDDNRILARLAENLNDADVNQFKHYFETWQGTWSSPEIVMSSDPRSYANSKEYEDLVNFCKKLGKSSLPLIVEQFKEHDLPLSVLIAEILLPGNEQLLADVKKENLEHLYDQSNVYIVRSSSINCLKFLRRLLVQQANSDAVEIEQNYPNTFSTSTTFSFYLPQKSTVTIELYSTQSGQLVSRIANEVNFGSGWQKFRWANDSVLPGTYLYRTFVNGKVTGTKRLLIK